MKVKCISQCQRDRKIIYIEGNIYDIEQEIYEKNKNFFKLINEVDYKKEIKNRK